MRQAPAARGSPPAGAPAPGAPAKDLAPTELDDSAMFVQPKAAPKPGAAAARPPPAVGHMRDALPQLRKVCARRGRALFAGSVSGIGLAVRAPAPCLVASAEGARRRSGSGSSGHQAVLRGLVTVSLACKRSCLCEWQRRLRWHHSPRGFSRVCACTGARSAPHQAGRVSGCGRGGAQEAALVSLRCRTWARTCNLSAHTCGALHDPQRCQGPTPTASGKPRACLHGRTQLHQPQGVAQLCGSRCAGCQPHALVL